MNLSFRMFKEDYKIIGDKLYKIVGDRAIEKARMTFDGVPHYFVKPINMTRQVSMPISKIERMLESCGGGQ